MDISEPRGNYIVDAMSRKKIAGRSRRQSRILRLSIYVLAAIFVVGVVGTTVALPSSREFLISRFYLHALLPMSYVWLGLGFALTFIGMCIPTSGEYKLYHPTLGPTDLPFALWAAIFLATVLTIYLAPGDVFQTLRGLMSKANSSDYDGPIIYLFLSLLIIQCNFISLISLSRGTKREIYLAIIVSALTAALCFFSGSRMRSALSLLIPATYALHVGLIKLRQLVFAFPALVSIVYVGDVLRRAAQGRSAFGGEGPLQTFASAYSILDPMPAVILLRQRLEGQIPNFTDLLTWYAPSAILEEEKVLIGPVLARSILYGDSLGGITLGIYGEFLFYAGPIGLVIFSLTLGFFLRRWCYRAESFDLIGVACFLTVFYTLFSAYRDGIHVDLYDYIAIVVLLVANTWLYKLGSFSLRDGKLLSRRVASIAR